LEKPENIKGSNDFFSRKKENAYKHSKFAQVQELCDQKKYPNWTLEHYQKRHGECKKKLLKFFAG
jgi:hypothetical protein